MNYKDAVDRALVLNAKLKHTVFFARPVKSKTNPNDYDVQIVDTRVLVKQHEAGKPYDGDDVPLNK